ncbi:BAG family molecular chaperone regulator 5, mitochondrial-like [Coffea arabica]|uniref:BAG family molecular chaperone regulator 5, mitochondrial-like n=1 Tax=Coffea arabica TaxID=13443 RepID=A0A6P6U7U3_COFAR|nr:BAG family molecular chaperone regulator 5, mitochondrial-like [Coffea arabica]
MKSSSSRRSRGGFFSSSISTSSASTITYTTSTFQDEHPTPHLQFKTSEFPNSGEQEQPSTTPVPISVHHQESSPAANAAALKIQSAYRAYLVRSLVKKLSAVNSEANYWERHIQCQETVDAVRTSERERIKINEALMGLLLRLDSVPGTEPNVRALRRHLSRRIVGLQEILDAVCDTRVENWDVFLRDWDDVISRIEKEACRERGGGHEMERFCAEYLGFNCLQRFLRDQ